MNRCQRGSMERKTSKPIFATRTIAMQVNVISVCAFKPKFAHSVCVHFTETYSVQEIWFYPSWHSFCPQLFWLEISNLSIFRIKPLVEYLSLQQCPARVSILENSWEFFWNFTSRSRSRVIFISLSLLDLDFQSFLFHFHFSISISSHFFSLALLEKSE